MENGGRTDPNHQSDTRKN
jgi:ornithine cyclodeaminase